MTSLNKTDRWDHNCWGVSRERQFIDNLGMNGGSVKYHSPREWLILYIDSHQNSTLRHHIEGVEYAIQKLEEMDGG